MTTMSNDPREREPWLKDGDRVVLADDLTDLLDAALLHGPSDPDTKRVLARVEAALSSQSAEWLFYDVVPSTPFGPIYIAVSAQGITDLTFDNSDKEFRARLQKRQHYQIERSPERVREVAKQLGDYFSGQRASFDLPLDLRSMTAFQRAVLSSIQEIPAGATISYGGLARRIGKPGSARAVGRALGSNPVPIIIPCHRVLAADGSLGGYSGRGGVGTKQALLELEGAL
jgi:methylated-DNA-[protein]-cysteine S-methyltransferase